MRRCWGVKGNVDSVRRSAVLQRRAAAVGSAAAVTVTCDCDSDARVERGHGRTIVAVFYNRNSALPKPQKQTFCVYVSTSEWPCQGHKLPHFSMQRLRTTAHERLCHNTVAPKHSTFASGISVKSVTLVLGNRHSAKCQQYP